MHPLRRSAALVLSVLVLQFTLAAGRFSCDSAMAEVASAVGAMADMPMGEHPKDGCSGRAPGSDCTPSSGDMDCQAMTSCAPGIFVEVLNTGATAARVRATPTGHLLDALIRTSAPEPPPPRA